MKHPTLLASVVALTTVMVYTAGYWIHLDSEPNRIAVVSTTVSARMEQGRVFHDKPNPSAVPLESPVQSARMTQQSVDNRYSPALQPDLESVQSQPASIEDSRSGEIPLPPPKMPLAFRELSLEAAAANPQMADAIKELRKSFIDAVGGPGQNPSDPSYYNRWIAAQRNADEQYRLLIGDQDYLTEQMQVNNQ